MRVGAHSGLVMGRWHCATALALFALVLLPINYRAGAATPHGHALLQLIHEAHTGIPAHHHRIDEVDTHRRSGDVSTSHTGAPPVQVFATSALLPMILLALALRALRTTIRQVSDMRPPELAVAPGHPPPELAPTPTNFR